MYQCLALLDTDPTRQFQMQERRKTLLTPLVEALNPKAYMTFYQQLLNELIEINSAVYDNRYQYYFVDRCKVFSEKRRVEFNTIVQQMLKDNQTLFAFQLEDTDSKTKDAYQSLINAQLNIAKAHGKFITEEKQVLREHAIQQLHTYQWIQNYITTTINQDKSDPTLAQAFQEQQQICAEMVQLLPAKISKLTAALS